MTVITKATTDKKDQKVSLKFIYFAKATKCSASEK